MSGESAVDAAEGEKTGLGFHEEEEWNKKDEDEEKVQMKSRPNNVGVGLCVYSPRSFEAASWFVTQPQLHLQVISLTSTEPRPRLD